MNGANQKWRVHWVPLDTLPWSDVSGCGTEWSSSERGGTVAVVCRSLPRDARRLRNGVKSGSKAADEGTDRPVQRSSLTAGDPGSTRKGLAVVLVPGARRVPPAR